MDARRRLAWIPAFLLGFVAATAGELAGGLLLYSGEGFLQALSLVLGVELGGLGLGLWAGARDPGADALEDLRRRWVFCLLFYAAAAGFAAAWQMADAPASSFFHQGLGLALLGGLPLYGVGAVLGGMGRLEADRRGEGGGVGSAPDRDRPVPVAVAALGGALGVVVTGLVLFRWLQPVSILLLCVVVTSSAALSHGWILEGEGP